jgi:hypothetical protein
MDILILSIFIWIWKFTFQLWKFCIEILNNHLIWTWNFNSKLLFWILKLIFQVWNLLIESKNGHFNFEYCYLNLKIDISILEIVV